MPGMLPGIETLTQHQEPVQTDPGAYRPKRRPHCGKAGPRGASMIQSGGTPSPSASSWIRALMLRHSAARR